MSMSSFVFMQPPTEVIVHQDAGENLRPAGAGGAAQEIE